MKANLIYLASAALIGAAWIASPHGSQAGTRKVQLSISRHVDTCAGLEVRSTGQVARTTETFTAPKGSLEIFAQSRGMIRAIGSDRSDYHIEVCKIAAADDRASADRLLSSISIGRNGNRFTESGPSDGEWQVYFIVRAPRDAALDLEARNGPVTVKDVAGRLRVRSANGPITLIDCGGDIQARASNGPITFSGSGGNVSLATQHGPVTVTLSGTEWKGPLLEARTVNGPVSLRVPDNYRSGVQVDTSGHGPFACNSSVCNGVRTETHGSKRSVRMNGANPVVRLSTDHGPVAVHGGKAPTEV